MHPISKRGGKAVNKFAVSVQGLAHVVLAATHVGSGLAWLDLRSMSTVLQIPSWRTAAGFSA